jgi:protein phosphatase 2C family protein 2/3
MKILLAVLHLQSSFRKQEYTVLMLAIQEQFWGSKGTAKDLSYDHKPQNEAEKARICAAGGYVDYGRVNGNLALSRAIGDFEFKKNTEMPPEQQIVTAFPDVTEHLITSEDEFVLIACDGIWDCVTSQIAIEFVRRGIAAGQDLSKVCENLMNSCLAPRSDTGGVGCDNMTVIIIALLQDKESKQEWYDKVKKRVDDGDGPVAPPEYAEHKAPRFVPPQEDPPFSGNFGAFPFHQGSGRVIMLGDGTELYTDAEGQANLQEMQGQEHHHHNEDVDMHDHGDEDQDMMTPSTMPDYEKDHSGYSGVPDGTTTPSTAPIDDKPRPIHHEATVHVPTSVNANGNEENPAASKKEE